MSLVNIKNVHQKLFPSQHSQLQVAALKMEMEKLEQLRNQWENLENKNVEKLTNVLSNVEKLKKRTKSPMFKAQVAISEFLWNNPLALVGLIPVMMATVSLGVIAGFAVGGPQVNVMPFVGGAIGLSGPIAVGVSCLLTAEKYEEKTKAATHVELFQLLPKLASNPNPQLNTCMQQLYHLGADEKIPGPFWQQCVILLREIHCASDEFQSQQNRVEQEREKLIKNDPQTAQAFENQSFIQRHQKFVKVNVESKQDIQKDSVKQTSVNAVKI